MKKKVLFVAAAFLATATFAQDGLTSKKGEAYLPEAGDWAVGFDGTPLLNYAGNLFNGNTNNTMTASWVGNNQPMTLVGKMFVDESTAYRGKLRLGFGSTAADVIGFYDDDFNPSTNMVEYINTTTNSNMMVTIGGGIEKRKGSTRLQGYYGGEALISMGSSSTSYDYGRDYTETWSVDEVAPNGTVLGTADAQRVTERSAGSTLVLGVRGFVGVEYFFAPKMSVGAEIMWTIAIESEANGEMTETLGYSAARRMLAATDKPDAALRKFA